MDITPQVRNFANFLNLTFGEIRKLQKEVELQGKDPWHAYIREIGYLQFIWETFVETLVCDYTEGLSIYREGADYEDSSRVSYIERRVDKEVFVRAENIMNLISGEIVNFPKLDFLELVSFVDGYYDRDTPFDYVLCEDSLERFIFKLTDVIFFTKKI
jgi:hypothetical protein